MKEKVLREIFRRMGYDPTVEQWEVHLNNARTRQVCGGERSGKSYSGAMDLLGRFPEIDLAWLVGADYEQTRPEFAYICDGLEKLGIDYEATKQVDPGEIRFLNKKIVTKSAKDPRKLGREAPNYILACEAAQLDYESYLRLRFRVAEKRGSLLLSGTFESSLGWYPELFERGQLRDSELASFSIPSWTNLKVFPGGRQDQEIKALEAASSYDFFMERFGGVPCPPKGRVFNEFRVNLHTGNDSLFRFDPAYLVHLYIDPGFATAYVVLAVQQKVDHLYVVDEIYEKGLVTSDIITICKQKPYWDKIIDGYIDIAAKQHQAMPAVSETWVKEAGIYLRSNQIRIQDGIERVKHFLNVNPIDNQPRLHINTSCRGLISEMGGCPSPIDGQTKVYSWKTDKEGNTVSEVPEDRHNHACKALAYGIIGMFGYSIAQLKKRKTKFF